MDAINTDPEFLPPSIECIERLVKEVKKLQDKVEILERRSHAHDNIYEIQRFVERSYIQNQEVIKLSLYLAAARSDIVQMHTDWPIGAEVMIHPDAKYDIFLKKLRLYVSSYDDNCKEVRLVEKKERVGNSYDYSVNPNNIIRIPKAK